MLHSIQGAVDVLQLEEPLNHDSIRRVDESFKQTIPNKRSNIVLDLKGLPLMDSVGLEWLLDIQGQSLRQGGSVKLSNPNHLCLDILEATGVIAHFEVFPDTTSAVASFSK